jgi:hypothetical protein
VRLLVMTLAVAALVPACGSDGGPRPDSPLLTARRTEPAPVDVPAAASSAEGFLVAALRPHRDGAARLGPHRFQGTHKLRVKENGADVEALDEETLIEQGAKGFHAVYKNSRDYGREVFLSGDKLWLRPRYGKYHRRPPVDAAEPAKLLDETFGTFAADMELATGWLAVTAGEEVQVAGRPARRVTLALAEGGKPAKQTLPQRGWREGATVLAVSGTADLDAATGVVLAAAWKLDVRFVREGRTFDMNLEGTHAVTDVGTEIAITPPPDAESVDTPGRSTELDDRNKLLEGIAPPAGKAPTPKKDTK